MGAQDVANGIGVVVIGRNEGERLRRCLESVCGRGAPVVYVDSGSTDGSVDLGESMGCDLVELDPSRPFDPGRARNEGSERLCTENPEVRFVQFVDGDCELAEGWIRAARRELGERANVAIVAGRLRERDPEASIYSRLHDMEWDQPVGEVSCVGGIFMVRRSAFEEVGGFKGMIAGADPELCVHLRQHGWKVLRIDVEMGCHDGAMMRFGQWWRRAVRTGHGYAEGAALHGRSPDRHYVRQVFSALLWGMFVPITIVASVVAALAWAPWAWIVTCVMICGYPVLTVRAGRGARRAGRDARDALLYAGACVLAKFPEAAGILRYGFNRVLRRRSSIIEYKDIQFSSKPS